MKAKEIILLIFIILVGVLITKVYTGRFDLELGWGDSFLFGYEEFVFEETKDIETPLPLELRIRNSYGSIEIIGSDAEKITISFGEHSARLSPSPSVKALFPAS